MGKLYLPAGGIVITDHVVVISTVLGSCVSVALHHAPLRLTAMCHGLLPACSGRPGCTNACDRPGRYISCSVRLMTAWMHKLGAGRADLQAWVFGGADMFRDLREKNIDLHLGRQNVDAAFQALAQEKIPILDHDTGGVCSRRVQFDTTTGTTGVWRSTRANRVAIR